jgi:competence protein ComEC
LLTAALSFLGGLTLMLPRGIPWRWLGLVLMAPLILPPATRPAGGEVQIEVLDVGQGLAALVSTENHTLLYDSGPGDNNSFNLVRPVITPAIAALAMGSPDRLVISHGDLDHAGGLAGLKKRYPEMDMHVNLRIPLADSKDCRVDQSWTWDKVNFEVLHPSTGLPYLGNDSSCVVSVKWLGHSMLLTGDISDAVERRLVDLPIVPHELVLVPHHGSNTSSHENFLAQVSPQMAIASAGLGNRFGFPRPEVRRRYDDAGSEFWSTGVCGAIRVYWQRDGTVRTESARRNRNRLWRWPAAVECP